MSFFNIEFTSCHMKSHFEISQKPTFLLEQKNYIEGRNCRGKKNYKVTRYYSKHFFAAQLSALKYLNLLFLDLCFVCRFQMISFTIFSVKKKTLQLLLLRAKFNQLFLGILFWQLLAYVLFGVQLQRVTCLGKN